MGFRGVGGVGTDRRIAAGRRTRPPATPARDGGDRFRNRPAAEPGGRGRRGGPAIRRGSEEHPLNAIPESGLSPPRPDALRNDRNSKRPAEPGARPRREPGPRIRPPAAGDPAGDPPPAPAWTRPASPDSRRQTAAPPSPSPRAGSPAARTGERRRRRRRPALPPDPCRGPRRRTRPPRSPRTGPDSPKPPPERTGSASPGAADPASGLAPRSPGPVSFNHETGFQFR